jgi:hypothetical protein
VHDARVARFAIDGEDGVTGGGENLHGRLRAIVERAR